jgi:hypothetical protein
MNGRNKEHKRKPYIMDELLKKSSWMYLILYFIFMIISVSILSFFQAPSWTYYCIVGGFGVLGQALIKDKFITSAWTDNKDNGDPEKKLMDPTGKDDESGAK